MRIYGLGRWLVVPLALLCLAATRADSPLIEAVKKSDKRTAVALLRQRHDINAAGAAGQTALHWAAYRDDLDMARLLLGSGASVNAANDLGITPLWIASTNGSAGMIAELLKSGANPNLGPSTGGTPLMIASRTGNLDAVRLLLAHGADVDAKETSHDQTALMWAIARQHIEIVRVLLEHKADVHARSKIWRDRVLACCPAFNGDAEGGMDVQEGGFTPLLFAARYGDPVIATLLLATGANKDDSAASGTSALALAIYAGHRQFARILLESGADPNASGAGYAPLHAAVLRRDVEIVKALVAHGANPNGRLTKATPTMKSGQQKPAFDKTWIGATPYLLAAGLADVDAMRVLAASGADVRLAAEDGTTPLMMAVRGIRKSAGRSAALDATKLVVGLGADLNAANHVGDTALHIAARQKVDSIVQFLADSGATLNVRNKNGQTPLAVATMAPEAPKGAFVLGDLLASSHGGDDGNTTADLLRTLGGTE